MVEVTMKFGSSGGATLTHILVAHDGTVGLDTALNALDGFGFEVSTVEFAGCLEKEAASRPDVVIVDLGEAESQGLKLCGQLRTQSHVPIIALGSNDRWLVPALSAGADDYLAKPLDLPTLLARLIALLRRFGLAAKSRRLIQVRDLVVDLDRCQVTVAGRTVHLTPIEYRLLTALARREGKVASCAELAKEVQGYEVDEQEARDIIKVHVYHLRRKLQAYGAEDDYVVTVPGFGYVLERRTAARMHSPTPGWLRRGVPVSVGVDEAVG